MKIGYFVPQFPGQTHSFFWREIRALEKLGVEPVLISTRRPPPGIIAHDWSAEAMRRTQYLMPMSAGPFARALVGGARAVGASFSAAIATEDRRYFRTHSPALAPMAALLRHLAGQHRFTHVHVHSCASSAAIALLAAQIGGPGYSLTLHGPLGDYGPGQRSKWRHATFATVITQKLKAEVETALAGDLPPLHVQSMGVDTDHFHRPTPYAPMVPGGPLRIFSCGRLNPIKGHLDLIDAVGLLAGQGMDVRLDIAGEDEGGGSGYHRTLDAAIRDKGLSGRVTLLGAVSEAVVRAKLFDAHVFALASLHEPLGVAYMEAMSCEVPVIGTRAGGVEELIEDGVTGVLVPAQSPGELAAAISALAADPSRATALATAGRQVVVDKFGAQRGAEVIVGAIAGR